MYTGLRDVSDFRGVADYDSCCVCVNEMVFFGVDLFFWLFVRRCCVNLLDMGVGGVCFGGFGLIVKLCGLVGVFISDFMGVDCCLIY